MSPNEIVAKFERWLELKDLLPKLQKEEMELREVLVQAYFPQAPSEGTSTCKFDNGWQLKLVTAIRRTCENKRGETEAVAAQLPPEVAAEVFRWKPDLKLRGYRELTDGQRALVDSVVTSTPATPQLTMVPPKQEK